MKRLLLILLISLSCEKRIQYDIKYEVVMNDMKIRYEGVNGLYYDVDGRNNYNAFIIAVEKKYYLVEKGIRTKLLNGEMMERLIRNENR